MANEELIKRLTETEKALHNLLKECFANKLQHSTPELKTFMYDAEDVILKNKKNLDRWN